MTIETAIKKGLIKIGDILCDNLGQPCYVVKRIITHEVCNLNNGVSCDYFDKKEQDDLINKGYTGIKLSYSDKYIPFKIPSKYKSLEEINQYLQSILDTCNIPDKFYFEIQENKIVPENIYYLYHDTNFREVKLYKTPKFNRNWITCFSEYEIFNGDHLANTLNWYCNHFDTLWRRNQYKKIVGNDKDLNNGFIQISLF